MHREPAPKAALPVITFNETATVHINGEDIRAVHFRTATRRRRGGWVHAIERGPHGRRFFNGVFPFIDVDSGGSVQGLIKNIEEIIRSSSLTLRSFGARRAGDCGRSEEISGVSEGHLLHR